ncbi:MAG TPA: TonB-dependent receptor [Myxococcaceae bacterium]|nr:TonB-dependent receptor [Myxococcaceae bacterium]
MPRSPNHFWRSLKAGTLALLAATGIARAQNDPETYETVVQAPSRLPESPLSTSVFPASVQVVTHDEIVRSGALTVQDVLERLPGVNLNDEQGNPFQMGITLRGITGSSVTGLSQGIGVFVDGVRVNEPDVEEINFDLIPLDDVERIELIRGPSAAFGRNSLAGALNIVTRRGRGPLSAEAEASGGSFGREKYRLNLGGAQGPVDYYFSSSQFAENGFRAQSNTRAAQAFGKLGHRSDQSDVTLSYQYHNDQIRQAGSLPQSLLQVDRRANLTGGDFFAPQHHQLTLNASQRITSGVSLTANAFFRALDAEQFNASLLAADTRLFNRTRSGGAILQLSHRVRLGRWRNELVFGAEYARDNVRIRVFSEQNERTLARCLSSSTDCPFRRFLADLSDASNPFGFYLFDTLQLGSGIFTASDSITLTAGIRFDRVDHDIVDRSPEQPGLATGGASFARWVPTAGLSYRLSEKYGLYIAYKEGFRAPAFLELTCADPNSPCVGLQAGVAPDATFTSLRAVKAHSYEAGIRANPHPWLDASVAMFRTDLIDDIYSVSPNATAVYFQNVGNSRREGVELSIATALGNWNAFINYTYTRATFQSNFSIASPRTPEDDEEVVVGNQLPLVPNHRLNTGIRLSPLDWATVSVNGAYVSNQFFRGDENNTQPKLKGYFVLSAGLEMRWKSLRGFVLLRNLLNTDYETFGTYANSGTSIEPFLTPGAPLHFSVGASYRL